MKEYMSNLNLLRKFYSDKYKSIKDVLFFLRQLEIIELHEYVDTVNATIKTLRYTGEDR